MANSQLLIAIGDLHGHYPALETLLSALERRGGVFGEANSDRLAPGVTLVFTGDYIDRGANALAVIERLKRLQERNPGRVVTLMGNHELLALQHLDEARRLAVADPVGGIVAYAGNAHGWNGGCEFVTEFGDPPGSPALPAYVGRMSREGDIGRWMRALLASFETRVAGKRFLFTHGDVPEAMLIDGALSRFGQAVAGRMAASSESMGGTAMKYGDRLLTSESASFFWCRDFGGPRLRDTAAVEAICERAGTDFIVTGHTDAPRADRELRRAHLRHRRRDDPGVWRESAAGARRFSQRHRGVRCEWAREGARSVRRQVCGRQSGGDVVKYAAVDAVYWDPDRSARVSNEPPSGGARLGRAGIAREGWRCLMA